MNKINLFKQGKSITHKGAHHDSSIVAGTVVGRQQALGRIIQLEQNKLAAESELVDGQQKVAIVASCTTFRIQGNNKSKNDSIIVGP